MRSHCGGSDTQVVCHDRYGYLGPGDFNRRACTLCYVYLFPSDWPKYVAMPPDYLYLTPVSNIRGTIEESSNMANTSEGSSTNTTVIHNNQMQVTI